MQSGMTQQKKSVRIASQQGWLKPLLGGLLVAVAMAAGILTYHHTRVDFETLSGERYQWGSLQGQWLVINYFAEWCAPCLREMPELNALAADPPDNTRIFALNYDLKSPQALREMATEYGIDVTLIVAEKDTPLAVPRPDYLPATYIVGPDGEVQKALMGEVTEAGLRQTLTLLKSQSQPL